MSIVNLPGFIQDADDKAFDVLLSNCEAVQDLEEVMLNRYMAKVIIGLGCIVILAGIFLYAAV